MPRQRPSRSGSVLVEYAIVAPVLVLLTLGILVGGLGIFRYHQIAFLARESSRWASVHGKQYEKESGQPAATAQHIYDNVIVPKAVGLDLNRLQYQVTWNTTNHPYHTIIVNDTIVAVTNTVRVTINYQWVPEALLVGCTLSSTSETPMSY